MPHDTRKPLASRSPKAWHRRAEEGDAAWACFRAYLDQPRPRNANRIVAPRAHPGAYPEFIEHWCMVHAWEERAQDYDKILSRHEHTAMESYAQLEAMRNLGAIDEGFAFVFRELKKHNAISLETDAPVLSPAQIIPLLKMVIELRRLAHGESTSNVALNVRTIPARIPEIESLSLEDLEALNTLQMKVLK
jgi:hypothetical protein